MEEALPDVEEAAPDVFGSKALTLPKKTWPTRAVRRTQSVVGPKGIKRSQHQDRCGVSWHYCH